VNGLERCKALSSVARVALCLRSKPCIFHVLTLLVTKGCRHAGVWLCPCHLIVDVFPNRFASLLLLVPFSADYQ